MARNEYTHTTILFTAMLLIQLIDRLEEELLWKGEMKMYANGLRKKMMAVCDREVPLLYGDEGRASFMLIERAQEAMMSALSEISPNDYPLILTLLEMYRDKPDELCERLEIKKVLVS